MTRRAPAVAGLFYPEDRAELEGEVQRYLELARLAAAAPSQQRSPKALIVPHAGYGYSGAIAASGFVTVAELRQTVSRVVLLGPSHRVALHGLGASSADAFTTPLGDVTLDREAIERALRLPQVQLLDAAHEAEHSLEVQLPFLQCVLGDFRLVPLSVGDATAETVDEVLELLWGGDETLIVVSSDLSHYYPYAQARERDAASTRAIESLDPSGLDSESACGRVPVRGLLVAARRRGLTATAVDVRNSGDTAGGKREVVGYGSYVFR